ncbi:MAG: hypothetical protein JXB14_03280 [Candidatus Altiarchaeota archaeon]|nr:hypothetical protein [Candidatus Altiarchaeota archaeon]
MPDKTEDRDFDELMGDLEDNIFGAEEAEEPHKEGEPAPPEKHKTLPTLVDQKTAGDVLKDVLKEKNQRRYDLMGLELVFRPYWFFTYTCELIMRGPDGNIADSEEIGGRIAIDAETGMLADYLQDLLEHEPIEVVELDEELRQVGEAKVVEPKIKEKELEKFVQQKISGVLRADKENVSVAGFELMWSPVYRFWLTIKKKTHNVQIDGCGGYPVNYDDIPLKPKTWFDIIRDDIEALKEPKKWGSFLKRKAGAVRKGGGGAAKHTTGLAEGIAGLGLTAFFLYGLGDGKPEITLVALLLLGAFIWYLLKKGKKPEQPPPPPPPQ